MLTEAKLAALPQKNDDLETLTPVEEAAFLKKENFHAKPEPEVTQAEIIEDQRQDEKDLITPQGTMFDIPKDDPDKPQPSYNN